MARRVLVRDRKGVAINNRDIRSQCLTIPLYTTCQSVVKYVRLIFSYRFFFFHEQTRTLILGVKNVPYVKENARCRRAVKIVVLHTV